MATGPKNYRIDFSPKDFFYEIIMTLFMYLESFWIISTFRFFIGNILDIFYTERRKTLWYILITRNTKVKMYFVKDNILRLFFITYIVRPLSAIASFILIFNTFIMFYRYFIIQSLYDFEIGISTVQYHTHACYKDSITTLDAQHHELTIKLND